LPLVLETLANSGMRLGECLAMRWNQLDISNRQYMVSETVRRGQFGLPKTGKRLIDLPEPLVKKLEQHIRSLRKKALSEGTAVEFLFTGISPTSAVVKVKLLIFHNLRSKVVTTNCVFQIFAASSV